ncbi:putative aminotransferase [Penicillium brasilianum]|uniref:Putative aminotransferase n=1 Tax=Penicillium brasilianum TaxID=104259 RepID=A0A1S9RXD2_PENBI|nr:putative aminotransferase [Penicillium brasilianum]
MVCVNHSEVTDPLPDTRPPGSFGAHPAAVREAQRAFLDVADLRPDPYIRVQHTKLLGEARESLAKILNAAKDECVLVKNATTGVATVLYNLNFQAGEVVVYFEPVYGAVEKGLVSLQEHSALQTRKVPFHFPIAESELEQRFHDVVQKVRAEGLTVRAAVFDTIVSNPGVRFPFERFTAICREEGILSVIDGAHGIGHIHLDMDKLQPDFFVSNCHKWLYTPRSAAVLYVPKRNQHLLRSTLPTSWGFIPGAESPATIASVLQDANAVMTRTPFEELFEFVATSDDSAYLCVPAALKFRQEVCGGEDAIISYCINLANEAADAVAAILGTDVMQEPDLKAGETSNMRQCALATIRLPIGVADDGATVAGAPVTVTSEEARRIFGWMQTTLMEKHDTFVPVFQHGPWLWVRISAQIYLEKTDFEWLGAILLEMCGKVARKEN